MVRKHHIRNLEIPGSMRAHRPGMTDRRARCARRNSVTSSFCRGPCARHSARRAWPSGRPPLQPGAPFPLPFRGRFDGFGCLGLCLTLLGFGLRGLAGEPCLLAIGGIRLALGAAFGHVGIVRPGLGAEFVQKISLRLLCGLLPVGEIRFLETTHQTALSLSFIKVGVFRAVPYSAARRDATHYPRECPLSETRTGTCHHCVCR